MTAPAIASPVQGEYLYRIAGCENCHTDRERGGAMLAGGRRLVTPLGVFVAPNITPDAVTGIGRWSEQDFRRALREGRSPQGDHYYPAFPYPTYTRLSDADIGALYAYLRTVPAARRANEPHELPWYLRWRPLLALWKWWYFTPGVYQADARQSQTWNRGAYLVQAAAHCGECHTPRNRLGAPRTEQLLAGSVDGAEGDAVPNITPAPDTGIGRWNQDDLVQYLESGMTPDGDFAGGAMAEFIDNGLKHLTPSDREAIAAFVLSLPPVENEVRRAKVPGTGNEFD